MGATKEQREIVEKVMNKIVLLIVAIAVLAGGVWLLVKVGKDAPFVVPGVSNPVRSDATRPSGPSGPAVPAVATTGHAPVLAPAPVEPAAPSEPSASSDPAATRSEPVPEPSGVSGVRLVGAVKNAATGQAIEGAVVEVRGRNRKQNQQETTDATGRYVVVGVTAVYRYIRVTAEGFDSRMEPVKIEPEQTGELVHDFELRPRARIAGQVIGPDGQPVEGARVDTSFAIFSRQLKKKPLAVSDARGAFSVFVSAGPYQTRRKIRLYARKRGLAPAQTDALEVRPGQRVDNVVLQLEDPGGLEGRVMRDDGRPFKGVHVNLAEARTGGGPPRLATRQARTRTDAEGRYHLEDLPAGAYRLTVWFGRLRETRDGVIVTRRQTTPGVDFTLRTGRSIAGAVVDETGEPVKHARVEAVEKTYDRRTGQKVFGLSDDDGSFQMFELKGAAYDLVVSARGHGRSDVPLVAPGSETLRVVLKRIYAVTGQVVLPDGETPCPAFQLQVYSTHREQQLPGIVRHVEQEDGRFALPSEFISGQPPLWIRAFSEDGLLSPLTPIHLQPGVESEPFRLVLAAGAAVTGTIQGENGAPIGGARVLVRGDGFRFQRFATSSAQGRFEVNALPEGTYVVSATHPDWVGAFSEVTVAPGQRQSVMLTLLEEGGTLHVTVFGKDGLSLPGAYITLQREGRGVAFNMQKYRKLYREAKASRPDLSWQDYYRAIIRTDVHGRLVRRFIPAGTYRLTVYERKHEAEHRTVDIPSRGQIAVSIDLKKARLVPEKSAPRLTPSGDAAGSRTMRKKPDASRDKGR
jgi:protocatechuate 3,4-dioxygenase beta subunit